MLRLRAELRPRLWNWNGLHAASICSRDKRDWEQVREKREREKKQKKTWKCEKIQKKKQWNGIGVDNMGYDADLIIRVVSMLLSVPVAQGAWVANGDTAHMMLTVTQLIWCISRSLPNWTIWMWSTLPASGELKAMSFRLRVYPSLLAAKLSSVGDWGLANFLLLSYHWQGCYSTCFSFSPGYGTEVVG